MNHNRFYRSSASPFQSVILSLWALVCLAGFTLSGLDLTPGNRLSLFFFYHLLFFAIFCQAVETVRVRYLTTFLGISLPFFALSYIDAPATLSTLLALGLIYAGAAAVLLALPRHALLLWSLLIPTPFFIDTAIQIAFGKSKTPFFSSLISGGFFGLPVMVPRSFMVFILFLFISLLITAAGRYASGNKKSDMP